MPLPLAIVCLSAKTKGARSLKGLSTAMIEQFDPQLSNLTCQDDFTRVNREASQ